MLRVRRLLKPSFTKHERPRRGAVVVHCSADCQRATGVRAPFGFEGSWDQCASLLDAQLGGQFRDWLAEAVKWRPQGLLRLKIGVACYSVIP